MGDAMQQVPECDGRSILIADDDPDSVEMMSATLASEGYGVLTACDGREAVSQALMHLPDVVLMDLDMPGMDGLDAARALKEDERTANIPVIFVTASSVIEHKLRALREGANDYLTKPFHRLELLGRVNVAVRLKLLQDALRERNRQLTEMVLLDGLTGLCNRRHLMERLSEEVLRAQRYRLPLSCLMLDLDHFKRVNDTYGHQAGDAVLRQFAGILRASARNVDVLGRYGGEEFTIVLPQTGPEGARTLAERIRQRVADTAFDIGGQTISCTTSVGVAAAPEGDIPATDWLIARADEALYRAKAAGRNQVVLAD